MACMLCGIGGEDGQRMGKVYTGSVGEMHGDCV